MSVVVWWFEPPYYRHESSRIASQGHSPNTTRLSVPPFPHFCLLYMKLYSLFCQMPNRSLTK